MRESYTNPSKSKQIELFGNFGITNRIHDTSLFKNVLRIKSAIRIFKVRIRKSGFMSPPAWIRTDLFHAIVLRIRQDSSGFMRICWIHENRLNLLKISVQIESTNRIF
jgi:hypothetical protein